MKIRFVISSVLYSLIIGFLANSFLLIRCEPSILFALIPVFLFVLFLAGAGIVRTKRSRICLHGTILLYAFCAGLIISALYQIPLSVQSIPGHHMTFVWSLVQCIGVLFVVFLVGIL